MKIVEMRSLQRFLTEEEARLLFEDVKADGTVKDLWALYMRTPRIRSLRSEMEMEIESMASSLLSNATSQEERWMAAKFALFSGPVHTAALNEYLNNATTEAERWDVLKMSYHNRDLFEKVLNMVRPAVTT